MMMIQNSTHHMTTKQNTRAGLSEARPVAGPKLTAGAGAETFVGPWPMTAPCSN